MGKYLQYILSLLTLSLLLFSPIFANSQNQFLNRQDKLESKPSEIVKIVNSDAVTLQTTPPTSSQIFADIIDILKERRVETGSWKLPSLSNENIVYYGVAGGLAGIGLSVLEARENDASFAGSTMNTELLAIAEQIASDLESDVFDLNSTHAVWEISDTSTIVDLGFDFGLAGIAFFYVKLFNQTSNIQYKQIAEKIFRSVQDLSNFTDGLHWQSEMNSEIVDSISWYNPLDFDEYDSTELATFTGISLGTAGIAKTALAFLRDTDDNSNLLAQTLLNASLEYLDFTSIINNTELSWLIAEEFLGYKATNYANGVVGIADLYLDLFQFTNNQTYFDKSQLIVNWLNGTVAEDTRLFVGYELNSTLELSYELGITHGVAGVAAFILKFYDQTKDILYLTLAEDIIKSLNPQRIETENKIHYAERVINGNVRQLSSNSRIFGTTGIFETLFELWNELDTTFLEDSVVKTKNFLLSQTLIENNFTGFSTFQTNKLENNPSVGLPSFLKMLGLKSAGRLFIQAETLGFDRTHIGETSTSFIELKNAGEEEVAVSWSFDQGVAFSTEISSYNLGDQELFKLNVIFKATLEQNQVDQLTIIAGNEEFIIDLTGNGFDLPEITVTTTDTNDTIILDNRAIEFGITVTDSSLIVFVGVIIDGSSTELLPTVSGGNSYVYTWQTSKESNGTHIIQFQARDISDNSNQILFEYLIVKETTSLEEKIFSTQNLVLLVISGLVLLGIAIIVTKKYMS